MSGNQGHRRLLDQTMPIKLCRHQEQAMNTVLPIKRVFYRVYVVVKEIKTAIVNKDIKDVFGALKRFSRRRTSSPDSYNTNNVFFHLRSLSCNFLPGFLT